MNDQKLNFKCDLCGGSYQMGRHIYDGKQIRRYQMSVCKLCYLGNSDGWAPHYEPRIISHLKEKKLPIPERNDEGLLPRD